ncbi:MAG: hypothetical protein Q8Q25_00235 [bacterium]|nr:hypothetical protein [bacterium]
MTSYKIKKIFCLIVILRSLLTYCMEGSYAENFPLHAAVNQGDYAKAQQLLKTTRTDVNKRDNEGFTSLERAILKWRVRSNLRPNIPGFENSTSVSYTRERNYKEIIHLLLEHGADILQDDVLHKAVVSPDIDVSKTLLSGAFSGKSSTQIEEAKKITIQNIWTLKQLGQKYNVPPEIQMLILSKMPEYMCSQGMLEKLLLNISDEELPGIIQFCSDKWLMMSAPFKRRIGDDEKAAEVIAHFRGKQTGLLLEGSVRGETVRDMICSNTGLIAEFEESVRKARLERLMSYIPPVTVMLVAKLINRAI